MKKSFVSHKRSISAILVVLLILPHIFIPTSLLGPHAAHAQSFSLPTVPVSDPALEAKEIGISIFGVTIPISLDGLVFAIASILLEQITTSVVNWINSGFDGNPAFVEDIGGFLTDVADKAAGEFLLSSDFALLCSPFRIDVDVALRQLDRTEERFRCTLTEAVENIEDFIEGDFSAGGWKGWFDLTTKPQNNPYGAYLIASDELSKRVATALSIESTLLDFGSGFRSLKYCEPPSDGVGPPHCRIETPGGVIESQLEGVLQIGQNRLTVADEVDEIIGAFLSQLLTQVITGAGGLKGYSGSSGSSPPPPPPPPPPPGGEPGPPITITEPGTFLTATQGDSRETFSIPVEGDDTYTNATVEFDVFIDTFPGNRFNGVLVSLRNPGEQRYFEVFINVFEEASRGRRTDINVFAGGTDATAQNWEENTNYHVQATYNTSFKGLIFSVTNTDTGEAFDSLFVSVPNNIEKIVDLGDGLNLGFGLLGEAAGGAYVPPYGWVFSNLEFELNNSAF